jgi:hypothetical protein
VTFWLSKSLRRRASHDVHHLNQFKISSLDLKTGSRLFVSYFILKNCRDKNILQFLFFLKTFVNKTSFTNLKLQNVFVFSCKVFDLFELFNFPLKKLNFSIIFCQVRTGTFSRCSFWLTSILRPIKQHYT